METTIERVTAVLSMIHESPQRNSATRLFRGEPVLAWTLRRIARAQKISSIAILCWEDQLPAIEPIAGEHGADVLAKGPRVAIAGIDAITAARRWADGWRGGLLATCDFDLGFYAPWHRELAERVEADAILLVDPAAALVDATLVDRLIDHAASRQSIELCFSSAAPGLSGTMLRKPMLDRLSVVKAHAGRLLHYMPDQPMRDPIGGEGCASVPTPVARTVYGLKLDSDRQLSRLSAATIPLNGQLICSEAEELVRRMAGSEEVDNLPRELVLEINTDRATKPIYWPGRYLDISREPMSVKTATRIFAELAAADDMRVTLGGVGDPLRAPDVFDIITAAAELGISAVHIETDLLAPEDVIKRLAAAPVDVVSVHIPAFSQPTYAAVMGVDAYVRALDNVRMFLLERQRLERGTPLIVPTFTKCAANLAEMEQWYDQWIRALGTAVISAPSTCGGQTPDVSVADMSPPRRRPCGRLSSRMTVLSDGRIASCEQDVTGIQMLGEVGNMPLTQVWRERFGAMRTDHRAGRWVSLPVCGSCTEWHRQ
ncbi:MAG TPA: SPASM domain-containing protein [Tepidisphaeraceae bacterium]|nr:SPASM domain-containing protein [Tepidisphaeraceae bacterium]